MKIFIDCKAILNSFGKNLKILYIRDLRSRQEKEISFIRISVILGTSGLFCKGVEV